jgi:hypothetical protein
MDGPLTRILVWGTILGFFGTVFGCWQCISGHNFAVAAQHEATTAGRVVGYFTGKGGYSYHYVFTVNGVNFDDYSKVCRTPLAPGACDHKGPVLVYYSFEPIHNSRLEDFSAASAHSYSIGQPLLAVGLPLFVLSIAALVVLSRSDKRGGHSDSERRKGGSKSDNVPEVIHIVPGE